MIIDFHTHIFPPAVKKDRTKYVQSDACFAELYSDKKAKLATADDLIASMDRDGVDISVALGIGWTRHEFCVQTNDYIMESIARYPKRLVGFCAVQPSSGNSALKEIERCARAGMRGVGEMRPDIQGFDFSDETVVESFVEVLKRHNFILLTHASEPVGHQYQGKGDITPEKLYSLITAYPDLKLVCAHWGGGLPFYSLMPEVKKAMANVYFDTAASPYLYSPQIYKQVVEMMGANKILFGSDYPLLSAKRVYGQIEGLDLPEKTKNQILSGNARRLLGI